MQLPAKTPVATLLFVILLSTLAGCKSKAEQAYANCMSQMGEAVNEAKGSQTDSSEAEKAIAKAAGTMAQAMGASVCGAFKEACDDNENGAICQAAIAQYK